eukprot:CAMPEP_0194031318 /NCGR_PEP_ID=MMETSP0009_2-20130614/4522_1 /TAXON_ID=210454 /ORGANISM="Grammatophora oceanica, Strain CCMP 410" /LENGTH=55 /DNA_ID=CAMNT_0038671445 /DNA_START=206 /DNA_END=370 /DNA_ORIENTATION=+
MALSYTTPTSSLMTRARSTAFTTIKARHPTRCFAVSSAGDGNGNGDSNIEWTTDK